MEVIILKDKKSVAKEASLYIANIIKKLKKPVLGLATGVTPIKVYENLIALNESREISFDDVSTFNLDEYVGLDKEHRASYYTYMNEYLFSRVNIDHKKIHIPNGCSENIPLECEKYEELIKSAGGIDLQLLGIGRDGHIGFNEPSSSLRSKTRLKTLTEQTRSVNSQFFDDLSEVPYHVLTMGVGTIMKAKKILLIAFGEEKADAVAACVEGPITAMAPASVLQCHEKVTVLIDESAASKLTRQDYYRWVYQQKPSWQKNV